MKNTLNLCIAILVLVVLGCSCPKLSDLGKKSEPPSPARSTPSTSKTEVSPKSTDKGEYDISMEKFTRLKIGMARSEVENILGGEGTEISSSQGGKMSFSVNKWEGPGYKSIILSFKNDKIMSKSQVGLK
ncbi:hypothetical protein BH10ACI3_BH10ACI3_05790 [soil metagenome]